MKRAFTLMELLVVIAIIGILSGLLLTALSSAKNKASKATDISNLKQIMVAVHLYAADNGDHIPPPNWDDGGSTGARPGWLYTPDPNSSGTNRFRPQTGLLWPSLQNPRVYVCPMDRPEQPRFSSHYGMAVERNQQASSYAMNGAVIGYMSRVYPPMKLAAMQPGDCAFWETDETEPYYFNDGANRPDEGVSARHSQGAIQAAFDGSVSYIRLAVWYQEVGDPNRNRLWCYPDSDNGR